MADEGSSGGTDPTRAKAAPPLVPQFGQPSGPVIYADGVSNIARAPGIIKFNLTRIDPHVADQGASQVLAAQIVCPLNGFVAMTLFFHHLVETMAERGEFPRAELDRLRRMLTGLSNAAP